MDRQAYAFFLFLMELRKSEFVYDCECPEAFVIIQYSECHCAPWED